MAKIPASPAAPFACQATCFATGAQTCCRPPTWPAATAPTGAAFSWVPATAPTCGPSWRLTLRSRRQRWHEEPMARSLQPGTCATTSLFLSDPSPRTGHRPVQAGSLRQAPGTRRTSGSLPDLQRAVGVEAEHDAAHTAHQSVQHQLSMADDAAYDGREDAEGDHHADRRHHQTAELGAHPRGRGRGAGLQGAFKVD